MKCECETEMTCIQDFCGNGNIQGSWKQQINLWCDYCPTCKQVFFGGYWHCIPPFPCETLPDENDPVLVAHIKAHEPACEAAYQKWLHNAA